MSFFSHPLQSNPKQFLSVPSLPARTQRSQSVSAREDVDDFLSSDLELSFASSVSLNSPTRDSTLLTSECEPMDISPAPPEHTRHDTKPLTRPRAFTSATRMFGHDMSNKVTSSPPLAQQQPRSDNRRTQRGALPLEWLMAARSAEPNVMDESEQKSDAVPSPMSEDAMDIDSDSAELPIPSHSRFTVPPATGLDSLFYHPTSPRLSSDLRPGMPQPKKRRSVSPEPAPAMDDTVSSSPPLQSSPPQNTLEILPSGNARGRFSKSMFQGVGFPPSNTAKKPRKLVLSALVQPSTAHPIQSASLYATSGDLSGKDGLDMPPTRRVVSALIPPKGFGFGEPYSDESSFEGPDLSSPAQAYTKRQQAKTVKWCDGTDDSRLLTGVTAITNKKIESPSSRFLAAGLPGFGDNEAHGKILPCHRVKEDGLMRINIKTLDDLLDGIFTPEISTFHVIDCRFDYEYNGGHVPGAVNINTPSAVEEFLLGSAARKPRPCVSGDATKKTVLVFHCEFSSKRAPTFAKHLRAKDRAMNNHVYPKIHYPEVYILEGGYCQYFKHSAARCEPSGYVSMDDPKHLVSRKEDLDQFRKTKFGRYKSYAYGEGPFKAGGTSQQLLQKRNTAPNGGATALFAAATAVHTRRGGGLTMLAEDGNLTAHSEEETDVNDSPCPPPTKIAAFKGKKIGRAPLARAETYGPGRMVF